MTEIYTIEICVVRGGGSLHPHSRRFRGGRGTTGARAREDKESFRDQGTCSLRYGLNLVASTTFGRYVRYFVSTVVASSKLCPRHPASSRQEPVEMSSRNAAVKILECLVLCCALSAVSTEGRSLQRIHKRHGSAKVKNSMELESEGGIAAEWDDATNLDGVPVDHSRRRHSRRRESAEVIASGSEEDVRKLGISDEEQPDFRKLPSYRRRSHAIKKRHNGAANDVAYATMSEIDEAAYSKSRARGIRHRSSLATVRNKRYEVEIKEAQNSSLCNYTVVDIPDLSVDNSRRPKNLFNVICNHAGSRCRSTGNYCCIQTYSKIDVSYGNGDNETLKIYTGCVCSLRLYGELKPYTPKLPIDY